MRILALDLIIGLDQIYCPLRLDWFVILSKLQEAVVS